MTVLSHAECIQLLQQAAIKERYSYEVVYSSAKGLPHILYLIINRFDKLHGMSPLHKLIYKQVTSDQQRGEIGIKSGYT